jgi:hypothetical protein
LDFREELEKPFRYPREEFWNAKALEMSFP